MAQLWKMFDLIQSAQRILQIPSASSPEFEKHIGNKDVALFLKSLVENILETKIIPTPGRPKDFTFVAWPKNHPFPAKGGLALHTHLDSVQAGPSELWTKAQPFSGQIISGKLFGLGAADVKCDSLCKLLALVSVADKKNFLRIPYFIGSFSEEIGMLGAKHIVQEKIVAPEFALVGEPSEGNLSYANKGFGWLEGKIPFTPTRYDGKKKSKIFKGKSAHSSAPSKGKNGLKEFFKFLEKNKSFPLGLVVGTSSPNTIPGNIKCQSDSTVVDTASVKKLLKIWKSHQSWSKGLNKKGTEKIFNPATATSEWTRLEIRKSEIYFGFDLRFLPKQNSQKLIAPLKKKHPEITFIRESPSFYQSPTGKFGKSLIKILPRSKKFITKSGSNEAYFYKTLGAEVFVHAPGKSYGNIHSPNEYVEVDSLQKAAAFYLEVIKALCLL